MAALLTVIFLVFGSASAFTLPQSHRVSQFYLSHVGQHVDDRRRRLLKTCCDCEKSHAVSSVRRAFVTSAAVIATERLFISTSSSSSAYAETDVKYSTFEDVVCGFQMSIPTSWEKTNQTLPDRRKLVLFVDPSSDKDDKTLLFIAYTSVRDDFTQISSFGSVDQVAQSTILPRGKISGEETESQMLNAENRKNSYYFDYVSKPLGQPKRHYRTIFSLVQGATGGAGSVLVTLTAQAPEARYEEIKDVFDEIINSYKTIQKS